MEKKGVSVLFMFIFILGIVGFTSSVSGTFCDSPVKVGNDVTCKITQSINGLTKNDIDDSWDQIETDYGLDVNVIWEIGNALNSIYIIPDVDAQTIIKPDDWTGDFNIKIYQSEIGEFEGLYIDNLEIIGAYPRAFSLYSITNVEIDKDISMTENGYVSSIGNFKVGNNMVLDTGYFYYVNNLEVGNDLQIIEDGRFSGVVSIDVKRDFNLNNALVDSGGLYTSISVGRNLILDYSHIDSSIGGNSKITAKKIKINNQKNWRYDGNNHWASISGIVKIKAEDMELENDAYIVYNDEIILSGQLLMRDSLIDSTSDGKLIANTIDIEGIGSLGQSLYRYKQIGACSGMDLNSGVIQGSIDEIKSGGDIILRGGYSINSLANGAKIYATNYNNLASEGIIGTVGGWTTHPGEVSEECCFDNDGDGFFTNPNLNCGIDEDCSDELWLDSPSCPISDKDLLLYYDFDASPLIDKSGNGNDGTPIDDAVIVNDGKYGKAYEFDGDGDYIELDNQITLTDSWSVSYWYSQSGKAKAMPLGDKDSLGEFDFFHYRTKRRRPRNRFYIESDNGNGGGQSFVGYGLYFDDWHHITVVSDGFLIKVYQDKNLLGYMTLPKKTMLIDVIGRGKLGIYDGYEWQGKLDELIVYDRELNEEEIGRIFDGVNIGCNILVEGCSVCRNPDADEICEGNFDNNCNGKDDDKDPKCANCGNFGNIDDINCDDDDVSTINFCNSEGVCDFVQCLDTDLVTDISYCETNVPPKTPIFKECNQDGNCEFVQCTNDNLDYCETNKGTFDVKGCDWNGVCEYVECVGDGDGTCKSDEECIDNRCIGIPEAYWTNMLGEIITSKDVFVGSTEVRLVFENTGLSAGTILNFEIYEDDILVDDAIRIGDNAIIGTVDSEEDISVTWIIEQSNLDSTSDYNQFYFKVFNDGNEEIRSGNLELIILETNPCDVIATCGNYAQAECGIDSCGVAQTSVPDGSTCGSDVLNERGCSEYHSCSCGWDVEENICKSSKKIEEYCPAGILSSSSGFCSWDEDYEGDNCDDYSLTYSWEGTWEWISEFTPLSEIDDFTGFIESPLGSGEWYYDPEQKMSSCETTGVNTIPCPERIQLPFFGFFSFIVSFVLIIGIYSFLIFREKENL